MNLAGSVMSNVTDADAGERLDRCIPQLTSAIDNWCLSPVAVPQGHILIAAATMKGAIVLHANRWPDLDQTEAGKLDRDGVALALAQAIESPTYRGDDILTGAAVLLGHGGIDACKADARTMRKPITLVLVAHDPPVVSWLITTADTPMQ